MRLSTENGEQLYGSTLSTSPDKKSLDNNNISNQYNNMSSGEPRIKIIITNEEEKTPSSTLYHLSPSLRKKISQTRLNQVPELGSKLEQEEEEIKEVEDEFADDNTSELRASIASNKGSFVKMA